MRIRGRLVLAMVPVLVGAALFLHVVAAADIDSKPTWPQAGATSGPKPKPVSLSVQKGITFLLRQQHTDGGWDGGVPTFGGFSGISFGVLPPQPGPAAGIKGKNPQPAGPAAQSDVADTSIAVLALMRAGFSPAKGKNARALGKAIDFICDQVESSDAESLSVTETKGILVQTKIGPFVDTFLAAMALAEARGHMPEDRGEKRVAEALQKIARKMSKTQLEDGSWQGRAWAPVLSQALASRAINRAYQVGIEVDPAVLEKTATHARTQLETLLKNLGNTGPRPGGVRPAVGVGGFVAPASPLEGAAGVTLYAVAAHVSAMMDAVVTSRQIAEGAEGVLNSPNTTAAERNQARERIDRHRRGLKELDTLMTQVARAATNPQFIRGFGSDGGEEFLSFMLLGETFRATRNRGAAAWDRAILQRLTQSQNGDASWSGKHCITGTTFCTATAIMSMLNDRSTLPILERAASR